MSALKSLSPLLAALMLSGGLAACGGGGDDNGGSSATTATPAATGTTGTPSGATGTGTGTGTATGTGTGTATGSGTGTGTGAGTGTGSTGSTGTAAPGTDGSGTTPPPAGGMVALTASVTAAPESSDTTIICSFPRIDVTGTGMKNVELVPADALSPVVARFNVSADGTFATLDFNVLPKNTTLNVRILAWDAPPGDPGSFVVAMAPRVWRIGDPAQPPCLSPGSAGAS